MTITINRRKLFFWFILIAVLLGVGAATWQYLPGGATGKASAAKPVEPPDVAAVKFAQAFYTLDYRNETSWLAKLQPLSSQDGYSLLNDTLAPLVWPKFTAAQSVATADQITVKDQGLKAQGTSSLGQWQIRAVSITIAPEVAWPDAREINTNMLLSLDNGAWKFGSFLDDASLAVYQTATGTATPAP